MQKVSKILILNIIFSAWYVEVMFTFRANDGLKLENVFKTS